MYNKVRCLILLFFVFLIFLMDNAVSQNSKNKVQISSNVLLGTKAVIYTTEKNTGKQLQLSESPAFETSLQPEEFDAWIFIDPTHQFESFLGFGGAITDASAETYAKLPKERQNEFLNACFDIKKGLGYVVVRTHMNSCDFSSHSYDYVKANDSSLTSFSIAEDEKYRLPLIQQAKNKIGKDFLLYVSPWSPPAWMKTNGSMLQGGGLKPECYQIWADYFIKYIQNYEAKGIPVWGMTVQNESLATQRWESCVYSAEQCRDFVKKNLGPALWKNNMKDKKVIVWDHNRDMAYQYASVILNDSEAAKYVWGTAFHWYEKYVSKDQRYSNIALLNKAFPDKRLIFTEGCAESFDINKMKDAAMGERYATNILNDLNSGISAWTDWNMLLDEKGGPNHVNNFCFAPIHANTKTGELIYTSSYTYIGHFSKFIRPGARRIVASSNRADLQATSFINSNGRIVVVVLNNSENAYPYKIWIEGKQTHAESNPHSISTWIF